MESIFEFIFGNIWFVIILFGIISSLFGKKDKTQQRQNRNPRPVAGPIDFPWEKTEKDKPILAAPPRNQGSEPRPQGEDRTQTVQESVPQPAKDDPWDWAEEVYRGKPQAPISKEITSVNMEAVRKKETADFVRASERKEKETIHRPKLSQAPVDDSIREALNFRKMNRDKVVQGVIWSQVLGKPRAKEPHRTYTQRIVR